MPSGKTEIPEHAEHAEQTPADTDCCKRCLTKEQGIEPVDGLSRQPKLSPADRRDLCHALAAADLKQSDLARRYDVTRQYVSAFAQQHSSEIAAMRERLDDELAGLWIANKAARITAYQDDYELSLSGPHGSHYEHIRTRTQIAGAVAEELGQLPPRTQVAVASVTYVVEGVHLDALK